MSGIVKVMASWYNKSVRQMWDRAPAKAGAAMSGLSPEWAGELFGNFTAHCRPLRLREKKMKFHRPITTIKQEIEKPIKSIAVIALVALGISVLALFYAMGRNNDATGS